MKEENFLVYVRVKPTLQKSNMQISDKNILIKHPLTNQIRQFTFNKIIFPTNSNEYIFNQIISYSVNNILQGYNSTIMTFGMTNSGKTYTMFGQYSDGIVFQCIKSILNIKNVSLKLSFYQIYNQNLKDLLSNQSSTISIIQSEKIVSIKPLTQFQIHNQKYAQQLIYIGNKKRTMKSTKNNQVSSRSHAIVQLSFLKYIERENQVQKIESKLNIVDLAGNQKTTFQINQQNERFQQGVNINKSLFVLGKCINKLSHNRNQQCKFHIPYRDSKLTRILKDSLGGNSLTTLIACINQQDFYYQQTLNTLRYAFQAKFIKLKTTSNRNIVQKSQLINFQNRIFDYDKKLKELQLLKFHNISKQYRKNNQKQQDNEIDSLIKSLQMICQQKTKCSIAIRQMQQIQKDNKNLLRSKRQKSHELKENQCFNKIIQMIDTNQKLLNQLIEKQKQINISKINIKNKIILNYKREKSKNNNFYQNVNKLQKQNYNQQLCSIKTQKRFSSVYQNKATIQFKQKSNYKNTNVPNNYKKNSLHDVQQTNRSRMKIKLSIPTTKRSNNIEQLFIKEIPYGKLKIEQCKIDKTKQNSKCSIYQIQNNNCLSYIVNNQNAQVKSLFLQRLKQADYLFNKGMQNQCIDKMLWIIKMFQQHKFNLQYKEFIKYNKLKAFFQVRSRDQERKINIRNNCQTDREYKYLNINNKQVFQPILKPCYSKQALRK